MRPLRIAVLDEELPYPLTSGKRIRTFNLLARLSESHRITILAHKHSDPYETRQAEEALGKLGIDTVVVPRAVPPKEGLGFYTRLAGNLLSPLPYSVATHTSPELVEAAKQYHYENAVDLWHCEWTPYAQVLRRALRKELKNVPWVIMAHNVESLIWKRYTETESNRVKRWYVRKQWKKFEKFERWAFANATWSVAVSEEDATLMRDTLGGTEQTEVVDNGVDTMFFRPQRDIERDPNRIVFLGSLDWRPNQDAVQLLLKKIFPAIRKQIPNATLALVGRNPPESMVQEAKASPGVELFANVPDVRPFLATSAMSVVPLRVGGGSRLKILESLATATAVVSTPVGAEGLRLTPDAHITIASEEGFADAVVNGLQNPDDIADQAERGRRLVLNEYDWGPLSEKLDEIWNIAVSQREKSLAHGEEL